MPIAPELLERIARNEYTDEILDLEKCVPYVFSEEHGEEVKQLTESEGRALVAALHRNTHIKKLLTHECIIPDSLIAELIENNTTITSLSIGPHNSTALSSLPRNTTLLDLQMRYYTITEAILTPIMQNNTLKRLTISEGYGGDIAAIALSKHPSIEDLSLTYMNVKTAGVIELGETIFLKRLNLSGNQLETAGITSLSRNQTLISLKLTATEITDECIPHLLGMTSLRELDISSNHLISSDSLRMLQDSNIAIIDASRTSEDRYLLFTFDSSRKRVVEAGPVLQVGGAATVKMC
jgi:hypothetical protein